MISKLATNSYIKLLQDSVEIKWKSLTSPDFFKTNGITKLIFNNNNKIY